jgi:hypothetical protein
VCSNKRVRAVSHALSSSGGGEILGRTRAWIFVLVICRPFDAASDPNGILSGAGRVLSGAGRVLSGAGRVLSGAGRVLSGAGHLVN